MAVAISTAMRPLPASSIVSPYSSNTTLTNSRFSGPSSTTRICAAGKTQSARSCIRGASATAKACSGVTHATSIALPASRETLNMLPAPGSLSTVMSPPKACANLRLMDRPRPVPPNFLVTVSSACTKSSKIRFAASGLIPIPVSAISI